MGFYSWKTADTKQSIKNAHTGKHRTVYMILPNGQKPIREDCYDGYGVFGDVDAYSWLGRTNAKALGVDISNMSEEEIRSIGIALEVGDVLKDSRTGELWSVFQQCRVVETRHFPGTYADFSEELGGVPNDLIASGVLKLIDVKDIVGIPFPLKFSFSPDAVYEDLPASEICPNQGYFF